MNPPPGWYPDPQDQTKERYYNGHAWTNHARLDVPKIPLAPWVDPAQHILTGGVLHDSSAPKSNRRMWLAVTSVSFGVVAVTIVGVMVSIGGF